jgi:signal transduction histidine kinase
MKNSLPLSGFLRQHAKRKLSTQSQVATSDAEVRKLLHELQVHQVELEMQNETLKESDQARCESDKAAAAEVERYTDFYDFSPSGFVSLDRSGDITQINLTCAGLLNTERCKLIKSRFGLFISQHDLPTFNDMLNKVFICKTKQSCEVSLSETIQPACTVYIEAKLATNGQECRITVVDITERKQTQDSLHEHQLHLEKMVLDRTSRLAIATEAAEVANRAKSEFLASVSHELRTPLSAMFGFTQLLEMDEAVNEEQQGFIQGILTGGQYLLGLINQLIDLSSIELGHIKLSPEHIELPGFIQDCASFMQPLLKEKSVSLNIKLPVQTAAVNTDRVRLKQVLLNLISNGIKYNHNSGSILIDVQASPNTLDFIRVSVSDTGHGITPEHMTELFQPFNRLGRETGNIKGTGIGLVITRNLVESMGGTLNIESELGVGTSAWFELPATISI